MAQIVPRMLLVLLIIPYFVEAGHYVHDYYKCEGENHKIFKKCRNSAVGGGEMFNSKYYFMFLALSKHLLNPTVTIS